MLSPPSGVSAACRNILPVFCACSLPAVLGPVNEEPGKAQSQPDGGGLCRQQFCVQLLLWARLLTVRKDLGGPLPGTACSGRNVPFCDADNGLWELRSGGGCVIREGFLEELDFNLQEWVECGRARKEGRPGEGSVGRGQLAPPCPVEG